MSPPQRWPLHPQPAQGESLSSWLSRVAHCYHMGLQDLLEHDLGHGRLDDLDIALPAALLDTLARRSGLDTDRLRGMTLAGLTPWLLDSVDPDREAFDRYVGQFSVLLPSRRRPRRKVPDWRAWIPRQPILRACPRCLGTSGNRVLLLLWQIPLTVGCPVHGCRLEPFLGTPGTFLIWANGRTDPRPVPEACAVMDRRTGRLSPRGMWVCRAGRSMRASGSASCAALWRTCWPFGPATRLKDVTFARSGSAVAIRCGPGLRPGDPSSLWTCPCRCAPWKRPPRPSA